MFYTYRANTLRALFKLFTKHHSVTDSTNPFQKNWIVVQNREMQQWLTLSQAKEKGISANNEFIFPSELIWKLYRFINPEIPKQLPSDKVPLHLTLFELFENGETGEFPFQINNNKASFELTQQISDAFDLYQVYRPEVLNKWTNSKDGIQDYSERWQAEIWNRLNSFWKKQYPEVPNRAEAFEALVSKIDTDNGLIEKLPSAISVFGLSHYSAPFIRLITSLAGSIDIHFYDLSYTRENKNSRLLEERWYKSKMDVQFLLKQRLEQNNVPHKELELFVDTKRAVDEEAVKIHSCHSAKREVEVLKDELLATLDRDTSLNLDDILILVPEMDEYGPIIKNSFSSEEREVQIPVTVPFTFRDPFNILFIELVKLFEPDEIKASLFLDFIQLEAIREVYNFTEDEFYSIKNWLIENSIHWGLGAEEGSYTLEKGLLNLFSGFVMEDETFQTVRNVIPFKKISTSEQIELIARLSELLDKLMSIHKQTKLVCSVSEWLTRSKSWINLIASDSVESGIVISVLDKFLEAAQYAKNEIRISFNQFSSWLNEQMQDSKATSAGLGRGIVLSTYIPYRSIPFRYIAILGFNEGVFPRNPARPKFDLIHTSPKPGDRIIKDDDTLLFLELLNSAEDFFHISYIGKDQQNEAEKLPSVFIQQLTESLPYLKNHKKHFIDHKLHEFDISYYQEPSSYSKKGKNISREVYSKNIKKDVFYPYNFVVGRAKNEDIINLQDMISFFSHPCKYYLSNTLRLRDAYYEDQVEDREVFKLSGLDKYKLNQLLIEGSLKNIPVKQLKDYAESAGLLPAGVLGEKELDQGWEQISELLRVSHTFINDKADTHEVNLDLTEFNIRGLIGNVYGKQRVIWRVGRARAVDLIDLWINHLLLLIDNNLFEQSVLISKESSGKVQVSAFESIANPQLVLQGLLKWYSGVGEGKSVLNFFPESSNAFATSSNKTKSESESLELALSKWIGSEYISGDGGDYYNELVWRGEEPLLIDDFSKNSILFWTPLLEALKEQKS